VAISREAVIWGFRLVLGREPESEEGIRAHQSVSDETALVEVLLRSPEFRQSGRFSRVVVPRQDQRGARSSSRWPHEVRSSGRVVIFGNCQAAPMAQLMQAMTGDMSARSFETTPGFLARLHDGSFDLDAEVKSADLVFVQMAGEVTQAIAQRLPGQVGKVRQLPPLSYAGFHPDCVYIRKAAGGYLQAAMGEYHSSIAFWAWRQGLIPTQAQQLFCDEVYDHLGFHALHGPAYKALVALGERSQLPLVQLIDRWMGQGCFMHTVNHPKLPALADLVAAALAREGIAAIEPAGAWLEDTLARWPVWPVYPELARRLGLQGSYDFKLDRGHCPEAQPVLTLPLDTYIESAYSAFAAQPAGTLECARVDTPAYAELTRFVRQPSMPGGRVKRFFTERLARLKGSDAVSPGPRSPYIGLVDTQFWRRGVERVTAPEVDPMVGPGFQLTKSLRVATAGSCFAQHIARHLKQQGFNYWVVDAKPTMPEAEAQRRGYGMFSARYGNVYTSRQLVQLFDRAHGQFKPQDTAWQRPDGRWVDPFRPQIEPDGFATASGVEGATRQHLDDVTRMFSGLDVFVFTLGLTEAWRRRADGAVFPLAPGVAGGSFDPLEHEFVNFQTADVLQDLRAFMLRLRSVNARARVILTVSPVPLIATYEHQHVLVSTIHSKSVLRAAAGQLAAERPDVEYFPSYEIITGPQAQGQYFEADLRSVRDEGVAHVMRVFFQHHLPQDPEAAESTTKAAATPSGPEEAAPPLLQDVSGIVCDEEAIERHLSS
jgi:hypothetical protein